VHEIYDEIITVTMITLLCILLWESKMKGMRNRKVEFGVGSNERAESGVQGMHAKLADIAIHEHENKAATKQCTYDNYMGGVCNWR
jgi:hypothetical protein